MEKRGSEMNRKKLKKKWILALKIGAGSALAIFLAHLFSLQNAMGAGTITLLTLLTTKRGTIKLTAQRLATFVVTVLLCCLIYPLLHSDFVAFGVVIFFLVLVTEFTNTQATLSVNALIAMHFFTTTTYDAAFLWNETALLLLGITIAIVFNMFNDYRATTVDLVQKVRDTDTKTLELLAQIVDYMKSQKTHTHLWKDLAGLEIELQAYLREAIEFQDNTFSSHPQYFVEYFHMRIRQYHVIHALHYEIRKIRTMPAQAAIIQEFLEVCCMKVFEHEKPRLQMEILSEIFAVMKREPMPETREEFESRALLYHILMDLEDVLNAKEQFIASLDPKALDLYRSNTTKQVIPVEEAMTKAVF